jgi:hypothetical protein
MTHGAVAVSMYMGGLNETRISQGQTYAYYNSVSAGSNHGVLLIKRKFCFLSGIRLRIEDFQLTRLPLEVTRRFGGFAQKDTSGKPLCSLEQRINVDVHIVRASELS